MGGHKIEERIYSQDVEDILGRKPLWVVRYGIPLITLVFIILLSASYFIPYPEKTVFNATTELKYLPESVNQESVYIGIPFKDEFIDLFKAGKSLNLYSGQKAGSVKPVTGQITGIITIPGTTNRVVILMLKKDDCKILFNNSPNAELKVITRESNMLTRILSPVLQLFKDPLSNLENKKV